VGPLIGRSARSGMSGCHWAVLGADSSRDTTAGSADPRCRGGFLRGDTSVVDFTYAFRAAASEVIQDRPLDGVEVELHDLLECGNPRAGRAVLRLSMR
jgi:hypothetical protein